MEELNALVQITDRQRLLAECRQLLHEVAKKGSLNVASDLAAAVKKDLQTDLQK